MSHRLSLVCFKRPGEGACESDVRRPVRTPVEDNFEYYHKTTLIQTVCAQRHGMLGLGLGSSRVQQEVVGLAHTHLHELATFTLLDVAIHL